MILSHGLTPEIGMLHTPQTRKEALVYDFEELFRQPMVDRALLSIFVRHPHSEEIENKTVVSTILKQSDRTTHEFGHDLPLSAIMEHELRKYIAAIRKKVVYLPYQHSWAHQKQKRTL